jgi:catechol 2,3-dioxygenase-like lactoylglutathione lyase family enzyme
MSHAPLPLIGTFHEFSVVAEDVRETVEFYERLGFTQATTTDTYTHPYGVLTDGRLYIGVHGRAAPSPTLTFVRPGVASQLAAFERAGIELARVQTGDEVFNEVLFSDPFGQAVAVLEARTYSPVARGVSEPSLCGDFAEVSLPVSDFAAAQAFWEPLGFVAAEEALTPYPHLALTSDHIDIAFHAPRVSDRPMLVFREANMRARTSVLRERGVKAPTASRMRAGPDSALIEAPDGTLLLLLEESEPS